MTTQKELQIYHEGDTYWWYLSSKQSATQMISVDQKGVENVKF